MTLDDARAMGTRSVPLDLTPFESTVIDPYTVEYPIDDNYAVWVQDWGMSSGRTQLVLRTNPQWSIFFPFGNDDYKGFLADASHMGEVVVVMYRVEGPGMGIDSYIKTTEGNLVTLHSQDGTPLLTGFDIVPFPHTIAVRDTPDGRYRLYNKDTLQPVSDDLWDAVICEKYPYPAYNPRFLLIQRDGYYGMTDAHGHVILLPETHRFTDIWVNTYEEVWPVIQVRRGELFGAIGYDGRLIVEPEWKYLYMDVYHQHDVVMVYDGERVGGIHLDEELTASPVDYTISFRENDYWSIERWIEMFEERRSYRYTLEASIEWMIEANYTKSGWLVAGMPRAS